MRSSPTHESAESSFEEETPSRSSAIVDAQRMICLHPVVSVNAALLFGVALGWLAKRR